MNCTEFREHVGTEPQTQAPDMLEHRETCPTCAAHHAKLLAFDERLRRALAVDLPDRPTATNIVDLEARRAAAVQPVDPHRKPYRGRWLALAASAVLGVMVGAGLWSAYPQSTLAEEIVEHMAHEPEAFESASPLPESTVAYTLRRTGLKLAPAAGAVTYAEDCLFQGHWVPHLVVQTAAGPVTVMVIRHRTIARQVELDAGQYRAVVLPAPEGGVAIIGERGQDVAAAAAQVSAAVVWQ